MFEACEFDASGDVPLGGAVQEKCEADFLGKLDGMKKTAYRKALNGCNHKYAMEPGWIYRSFEAFCTAPEPRANIRANTPGAGNLDSIRAAWKSAAAGRAGSPCRSKEKQMRPHPPRRAACNGHAASRWKRFGDAAGFSNNSRRTDMTDNAALTRFTTPSGATARRAR